MWVPFASLIGGAAAGLTGLIFIVVSFRFDILATSDEYRNRARQALTLFVTTIVSSALALAPQPPWALGLELLVVADACGLVLSSADRAARRVQTRRPNALAMAGLAAVVVALATAGVLLLFAQGAGRYIYALATLIALVEGLIGGWTFRGLGLDRGPKSAHLAPAR